MRRLARQGPPGGRGLTPLKPEVSAGTPETGKLRLNEWTTPDGERRSGMQVVADAVSFLDPPRKAGGPRGAVAEPAATHSPGGRPACCRPARNAPDAVIVWSATVSTEGEV